MKRSWLTIIVLLSFQRGFANIQLEPRIGLDNGSINFSDQRTGTNRDFSGQSSASLIGVKFGYLFDFGLFAGAEASTSLSGKITYGGQDSVGNLVNDESFSYQRNFLELGYYFPSYFRVYFGYGINHSFTRKTEFEGDLKFTGGQLWRIGLGMMIINNLSLDIEYFNSSFSQVTANTEISDFGTAFPKWSQSSMAAFISFPFQF